MLVFFDFVFGFGGVVSFPITFDARQLAGHSFSALALLKDLCFYPNLSNVITFHTHLTVGGRPTVCAKAEPQPDATEQVAEPTAASVRFPLFCGGGCFVVWFVFMVFGQAVRSWFGSTIL